MVCVPDGRRLGCLLSPKASYFPSHQTSVTALDRLELVVLVCWGEFPPAEPVKLWVTGATCKATVPKSCLSAAVGLVPQEHLNPGNILRRGHNSVRYLLQGVFTILRLIHDVTSAWVHRIPTLRPDNYKYFDIGLDDLSAGELKHAQVTMKTHSNIIRYL